MGLIPISPPSLGKQNQRGSIGSLKTKCLIQQNKWIAIKSSVVSNRLRALELALEQTKICSCNKSVPAQT
jgi:hypothetical protein